MIGIMIPLTPMISILPIFLPTAAKEPGLHLLMLFCETRFDRVTRLPYLR
jgi:hypothetical protein